MAERPLTFQQVAEEARLANERFWLAVAYELRLDLLADWLARQLRRLPTRG